MLARKLQGVILNLSGREKVTRSVQSIQHTVVGRFWGFIFGSYMILKKVMEFNQAELSTFHIIPTKHTVIFGWWTETSDRLSSTPTIICYRILISINSRKLDPTLLQLRPDKAASPSAGPLPPPNTWQSGGQLRGHATIEHCFWSWKELCCR